MSYDPFVRGPHPVGVVSEEWHDAARGRTLPVELYYPATSAYAGQDIDAATQDRFALPGSMLGSEARGQQAVRDAQAAEGLFPTILFSHGYSGDRREFSSLCTHLASHGYTVVSADHVNSTFADVEATLAAPDFDRMASMAPMLLARKGDIPFLLDRAAARFGAEAVRRAGVTGVSMGGWTSLIAPAVDARIAATVPMAPGGGDGPLGRGRRAELANHLDFDWKSDAAVLLIAGDRDSWLPLYGQLHLLARCRVDDKLLAVVDRADHQHFVDGMAVGHHWYREFTKQLGETDKGPGAPPWSAIAEMIVPFEELTPEEEASMLLFGLATWHFDRNLKRLPEALAVGDAEAVGALDTRGLSCHLIRPMSASVRQ